jgi:hypothetical protein
MSPHFVEHLIVALTASHIGATTDLHLSFVRNSSTCFTASVHEAPLSDPLVAQDCELTLTPLHSPANARLVSAHVAWLPYASGAHLHAHQRKGIFLNFQETCLGPNNHLNLHKLRVERCSRKVSDDLHHQKRSPVRWIRLRVCAAAMCTTDLKSRQERVCGKHRVFGPHAL